MSDAWLVELDRLMERGDVDPGEVTGVGVWEETAVGMGIDAVWVGSGAWSWEESMSWAWAESGSGTWSRSWSGSGS